MNTIDLQTLNWSAFVMDLNEEVGMEAFNGNSQAQGILNQIQTYNSIALTHTLADVLPVMTKLNCFFKEKT